MSTAFAPTPPPPQQEESSADAQDYLARLGHAVDSLELGDDSPSDLAVTVPRPTVNPLRPTVAQPNPPVDLSNVGPPKQPATNAVLPPWKQGSAANTKPPAQGSPHDADDERIEVDRPKPVVAPPESRASQSLSSAPMPFARAKPTRQGLFSRDIWANSAWGLAVGMAVALVFARPAAQRTHETYVAPVLAEINAVVANPLSAQAGTIKAPAEVIAALDDAQAHVSQRFWQVWVVVTLACAAPLVAIRRRRTQIA